MQFILQRKVCLFLWIKVVLCSSVICWGSPTPTPPFSSLDMFLYSLVFFFASLCFSCTVINSWVLCCQTREFEVHNAVWIISGDLYSSLNTFCIHCFTGIIPDNSHPVQCFPCWLSDPVHAILSKIKSRSSGQIQNLHLKNVKLWWPVHSIIYSTPINTFWSQN